jgi:aryl-alcohol dehydrogenase-like predicted oxidoreductase
MEYRALGSSGLQVSLAGLGTNNFGRRCDADQTATVVHSALDHGINFIDTADAYGGGLSEEYIGKALGTRRRDTILATKFVLPMGEGPLWKGASRRYVMEAVHASLRRLQTDYIDLYQVHFWDASTPIEETMRALDDLVHQGDVRYIGCSNFTAWQIVESQWVARHEHLTSFISAQNQYNLFERTIEQEVAPVSQRYGLSVIPYSPLAGGFLTGKYQQGAEPPPGARFSGTGSQQGGRWMTDQNYQRLQALERFAEDHDHRVGELALAWLASQPFVGSVIAGAMTPEQIEENVRAIEWRLSTDELASLDEALGHEPAPGRRGGPGRPASRS